MHASILVLFVYFVGQFALCNGTPQLMLQCDHDEADTRMCIHLKDALEKGARNILIRTVDTDVVVILVGLFFTLLTEYPSCEVWVAFGMGKSYQKIRINSLYHKLGKDKSIALPCFHAFTGCDTTSQFFGKGKSSAWVALESFPEATGAFSLITLHPFESLDTTYAAFQILERYTCVLYDKTTNISLVNELRINLFSKKSVFMENIPPTQVHSILYVSII